jgi:hypothetical protein
MNRTWIGLALLAGCKAGGGDEPARLEASSVATTTANGAVSVVAPSAPPTMPKNLPDPGACKQDTDCEVSLALDGTGCCNQNFSTPMSKAFRAAVDGWAKTACVGYVCPGQPSPGPKPAACFFQPRCAAGRCGNACAPSNDPFRF